VLWPHVNLVEREKVDVIMANQFVPPASVVGSTLDAITIPRLYLKIGVHEDRPCLRYPDQPLLRHHGAGTTQKAARPILDGLRLVRPNFTHGLSCRPSLTRCHKHPRRARMTAKLMRPT
jgi:hypothetical protein